MSTICIRYTVYDDVRRTIRVSVPTIINLHGQTPAVERHLRTRRMGVLKHCQTARGHCTRRYNVYPRASAA